jgi:glycerol-3-phosphate dehydrogenase (NAD(P)+)
VKVAVLGGGSWGTALAAHLARGGHRPLLWMRDPARARELNERHASPRYLPGVELPGELSATAHLEEAVDGADTVLVAVPSAFCRDFYRRLAPLLAPGASLVSATKGLEEGTLLRMSELSEEEAPGHPVAVLSGPSFALEVAQGQPTTVVVASRDEGRAAAVQRAVSTRTFRAYTSTDVIGVELGGALKNVIAIAAGITDGLGYGQNTLAALITRGLAEMGRLAAAMGARADTLAGLAGLGDLVLTCTGGLSRNRRVGQALGRGLTLAEALRGLGDAEDGGHPVAEGVRTTPAACALAARAGVEMPIAFQMQAVLRGEKAPRVAVDELMLRSLKRE